MTRQRIAVAGLLGLVGIALPVHQTAAVLVGPGSAHLGQVVQGLWLFKLLLVVHAALVVVLGRIEPSRLAGDPLIVPASRAQGKATGVEWAILTALLVIGTALRLKDLGVGLWFDEIDTLISYVRLPLSQIVTIYDSQNQHMLYSVLARMTVSVFGESAWALRLPAVLFSVASLGALYWFATQVASRREALLATALLTFSYHHVWFSQNARGYTGLLFWTLVGSGLFLKMLSERPQNWWLPLAYAASMALAIYTHVTAVLVVAAHALIWFVLWLRRREPAGLVPFVAFVLATTLTLQLYAIVLPQFLETLTEPTMEGVATEWKDPLWMAAETVRGLARGLPGGVFAVVAALAVCVAGLTSYARRSGSIAAVMVLPGVLTTALLLSMEHNLWPRFFFFSAGFAVLIAVRGVLTLGTGVGGQRGGKAAMAMLALVLVFNAATVSRAWQPKQDYQGAREYVERTKAAGDAVVTIDMTKYAYQQYIAPKFLGVDNDAELAEVERSHPRTWLLYTFPTRLAAVQPGIWSRLQREYTTAAEFPGTVSGGTIVVKVRP